MLDLDFNSLMVCSMIVTSTCGCLFAIEALRLREAHSLFWASALVCTTVAPVFYMMGSQPGYGWGFAAGNAVVVGGISLVWAGARRFNRKRSLVLVALVGPMIALMAALVEPGPTTRWSGAMPFLSIFSAYSLATAAEFWFGSVRYRNAIPFVIACVVNAIFYALRGLTFLVTGPDDAFFQTYFGAELATLVVMTLILICGFSLVAIGKEQSEMALQRAAMRDGLTDTLNRREFMRQAQQRLRRLTASREPVSVLLVDLDHFKKINDSYGHPVGDRVLVLFAGTASTALGPDDLLCRYGGEEFVILLPGKGEEHALAMAETIRKRFAAITVATNKGTLRPTASIGMAAAPFAERDLPELIAEADNALYDAKAAGRNRVASLPKAA